MLKKQNNLKNQTKKPFKKKAKVNIFKPKEKTGEIEKKVIENLQNKYENIDINCINYFTDVPLSAKTLKGLKKCGYKKLTEIQKNTIELSLNGKDILGAAQTGSGKTLAFIIPILEHLYCKQWTSYDGLGALVITPTRELAYQIFETLRKVGKYHDFSAGLIIGGKDLKFEKKRMDQCNIIICTPGRLLQHMDENPLFECVNLQILVLDEADRCLDMGFEKTMNAIIANLPLKRQTFLFSATQTKSVKDLARLSLKDPSYVSVYKHCDHTTPEGLHQTYIVCELKDKLSLIWSFIKNHLKKKIIIFFASCKETKYFYEIFCKLRPGISLLALYGTIHQLKRMDVYESFCRKSAAVLFATDIAARGLDFPDVHWVVQADCPEDVETYIHRVGRTARYQKNGESLMLLLSSEIKLIDALKEKKIPIDKTEINPLKLNNPIRKITAFLVKDPSLKDTAQRAFVSYIKSVFLMKNKNIFNVQALDTDSFAYSLGLEIPPRIRFLQRHYSNKINLNYNKNENKLNLNNKKYFDDNDDNNVDNNSLDGNDNDNDNDNDTNLIIQKDNNFQMDSNNDDSEDELFKCKRKDHNIDLPSNAELEQLEFGKINKKKPLTRAALAKKMLSKKILPNKKIIFDDDGDAKLVGLIDKKSKLAQQYENDDTIGGIDIEKAKIIMKEEDKFDKQLFREKIKLKHKMEKLKLKEAKKKMNIENEEDKDDFGGSDQLENEEPDLSWLPDPDKIYDGKKTDKDMDELEKELNIKTQSSKTNKRKLKITNETTKKSSKKKKLENITSSLDVHEAEELALILLKNK